MKYLKIVPLAISLTLMQTSYAIADSFDEFDEEMSAYENPDTAKTEAEYAKFVADYLSEFDEWRTEYLRGFDIKQAKVAKTWGTAEVTEKEKSVEYSKNLDLKVVENTEENEIIIEVLVDSSLSAQESKKVALKKIANFKKENDSIAIKEADLKSTKVVETPVVYTQKNEQKSKDIIKEQTAVYLQDVEKEADKLLLENKSIPENVVDKVVEQKKAKIKKEEMKRLAQVERNYKKMRSLDKNASKKVPTQKIVKYKVRLPKNSLAKRAKQYVPFAEKESKQFDMPVALVMAIMHSESAFKYKAKSHIPAYGLMQIVPRTAGHDVNKLVRNKDHPMTPKELYIPEVNVETGTAYLSIVNKRYLRKIKNPESRLYCTIAAYNTGAGNVAKAFNIKGQGSTRNINKASVIINKLTPQQVYDQLMTNLPYDETKHYLKKVSARMELYKTKS